MIWAKIMSVTQLRHWGLAVILALNLVFLSYFCIHKYVIFVDDGFSYSWANGSTGTMPDVVEDELCVSNPSIFNKQFTVQSDEIWNYKQSINNLFDQPPLYYFMLHAFSSFSVDVFSKWTGLSLNLIIFLLTQIVLYALSRQFLDLKKSLLVNILYGFSVAAVYTVMFIRCYILFTLLTTLLCLLTVKLLQALENNNMQNYNKNLYYFFLTLFCGVITHYYFLITAFALCAGICFILLCRKMYKKLAVFASGSLITIGLIPVLFSCVRRQFFHSDRSSELFFILHENFFNNAFDISVWNKFIKRDMLGHIFPVDFLLIVALLYGLYCLVKHQKINRNMLLFIITLIFSVVVISFVLPLNIKASGTAKRYFFHLSPLLALMFVLCLDLFTKRIKNGLYIAFMCILFFIICNLCNIKSSIYFYKDDSAQVYFVQQLKDKTLWIQWENNIPNWKMVEPALYSFYAKDFIIFRNHSDECYQNMLKNENAQRYTALMAINSGTKSEDCARIPDYKLVFSTWSTCAYLPNNQ